MGVLRSCFFLSVFCVVLAGFLPAWAALAAAFVTVPSHTLTDEGGGTLLSGDQVMVAIVVANSGDATATATLLDSLTNLEQPFAVTVNGFVCGTCSSTANSVTVQLGVPQGGAAIVQFRATVPSWLTGAQASSSAIVAFSPADPGTSPTSADIAVLSLDSIFRNGFE